MDAIIHGICPTCYLTVTSDQDYVSITGSGESITYHRECEPNRSKFMKKNAEKWRNDGENFKSIREKYGFSIKEISQCLQVSESKLRKFELGKPVTHARLLSVAIKLFYKNYELMNQHKER